MNFAKHGIPNFQNVSFIPSYTRRQDCDRQKVGTQRVVQKVLLHKTKHRRLLHHNPYLQEAISTQHQPSALILDKI